MESGADGEQAARAALAAAEELHRHDAEASRLVAGRAPALPEELLPGAVTGS